MYAALIACTATLAGCDGGGGELRDATEARRRLQQVDSSAAGSEDVYEVPVFADTAAGLAAGPAAPGSAPLDTTPAPQAPAGSTAQAQSASTPQAPASAQAPATSATGGWTSGTVSTSRRGSRTAILREIRVAPNAGFDRVVLQFDGPVPPHRVQYVDRPIRRCGSGESTDVAGDGYLRVRVANAQAHDDAGRAMIREREIRAGLATLKEVEMTCDFEGVVEVVLGVASPNQYRVLELETPSRLVVDVLH